MPYLLIIIGAVLLVSGVKDTTKKLFSLVSGDFAGKHTYLSWAAAILGIGAIGYIEELQTFSRTFMGLVVVVLFLSNGGFFNKFQSEFFSVTGTGAAGLTSTQAQTFGGLATG